MGDQGDGRYEAPIPGRTDARTIVEFYIQAGDTRGNEGRSEDRRQIVPSCGPG